MLNSNAKAYVKVVSVNPETKPDFATAGGFTVITEDGPITFDWCNTRGYSDINDKGHCELEWDAYQFDEEYFKDSNTVAYPDFNKIVTGVLDEVHYEAGYIKGGQEEHFEMDLVEFEITLYDEMGIEKEKFTFSTEQIEAYNKKVQAERDKYKKTMECQHEGCSVAMSCLICEIAGIEQVIYRCPNHLLIDLNEIVTALLTTKPIPQKCACCDNTNSYKVNYGGDGDIHLCLDDLLAFIELRLAPEKFKALYEKYPNHYMLHDDFYDAETGEALQPRYIFKS